MWPPRCWASRARGREGCCRGCAGCLVAGADGFNITNEKEAAPGQVTRPLGVSPDPFCQAGRTPVAVVQCIASTTLHS
jgi:hypothetical protein